MEKEKMVALKKGDQIRVGGDYTPAGVVRVISNHIWSQPVQTDFHIIEDLGGYVEVLYQGGKTRNVFLKDILGSVDG